MNGGRRPDRTARGNRSGPIARPGATAAARSRGPGQPQRSRPMRCIESSGRSAAPDAPGVLRRPVQHLASLGLLHGHCPSPHDAAALSGHLPAHDPAQHAPALARTMRLRCPAPALAIDGGPQRPGPPALSCAALSLREDGGRRGMRIIFEPVRGGMIPDRAGGCADRRLRLAALTGRPLRPPPPALSTRSPCAWIRTEPGDTRAGTAC